MMTRKDFFTLAQALKDARDALGHPLPRQTILIMDSLVKTVADVCAKQNAKFDRKRFYKMAGVTNHG